MNQRQWLSTVAASLSYDDNDDDDDDDDEPSPPPFNVLPNLHPSSLHAITNKLKLTHATEIQYKTFEAASNGRDVLGRARTGTGKTLAFLLPSLESCLRGGRVPGPFGHVENSTGDDNDDYGTLTPTKKKGGIAILILSPTRELALQIHTQAQILTSSHANSRNSHTYRMSSQVMYGGSSRRVDLEKLQDNLPYVLVATPGRLIDHMKNSRVGNVPFSEIIGGVSVLVLDEADRCLDMGFRSDMEWIIDVMKEYEQKEQHEEYRHQRQTLLFSATLPKDLRSIMASSMRKDFVTVDCIHDVDPTSHTNERVDQTFLTLPSFVSGKRHANDLYRLSGNANNDDATNTSSNGNNFSVDASQYQWINGLVSIVQDIIHIQNPTNYKLVVFFPTTALAQFFSYLFNKIYNIPVIEIHSQKSQSNRTYNSNLFRKVKSGVLFTTDVSGELE